MRRITFLVLVIWGLFSAFNLYSQEYELVWEDNFDGTTLDSSIWNIEQRVGIWNTGSNRELQHYRKENVSVGNDGDGNNCLILTAKRENYNGYQFTSGRVNTKGKFAFRQGKLEAMIKIPDLKNGLWPAFWTLGYVNKGWPDCGEIDVLEMGHAAGRNADTVNSFIGSHLFWGPYPRDYGEEFTAPVNLSTGYFKHTLVWDETQIRTYFNDAATPYFTMGITGADAEEFRDYMHYIILNLAVGGSVPGLFNISDITAPFPANMYIDWVKVYQKTGSIDFNDSSLAVFGPFGVFEETVSADMNMDFGYDAFVETTGLTERTGETPKEGNEVLSYSVEGGTDFAFSYNSGFPRNMANYSEGSIQFWIKTESADSLMVGISDKNGNEAYIALKEGSNLNPVRDGQWHFAWIPVEQLADVVDISSVVGMLKIKGKFFGAGYLSIDRITWEVNEPAAGYYGIFTNNPAITNKLAIDDVTGHIYIWNETVTFNTSYPAYEGADVLSLSSAGSAGWYGFGIFSDNPVSLESYSNGYLNLMLRTNSTNDFWIGVAGANSTEAKIDFKNGQDPYGFVRDGKWHKIAIPVADMLAKGIDLSGSGNIFMLGGGTIQRIAIDDIYFSEEASEIQNTNICYVAGLTLTPTTSTINVGATKKITATATDQFGKPTDADINWSASGGEITSSGVFSSSTDGVYTITAQANSITATAKITVNPVSSVDFSGTGQIRLYPNPAGHVLNVSGIEEDTKIVIYDHLGRLMLTETLEQSGTLDISSLDAGLYSIQVANSTGTTIYRFIKNH
ncbi:MAG: T9SS type A sorting domain-containing protein [Bacteroidales bacterium]|nr:T9SS type A sorting domain-containing protein [Bacteroidales bacterium]